MKTESKPWFNNWPAKVPKTIDYPAIGVHEILRKTAKAHPREISIVYYERKITYFELDMLSDKLAAALLNLGVKKGDRVALFLPNIPEFVISYFGILKAGAIVTSISPLHKDREVEHQLGDSDANTIIALDSLYPIVKTVWQETSLEHAVIIQSNSLLAGQSASLGIKEEESNTHSFQRLIEAVEANAPETSLDPRRDLAALQYTGGTTGTAKGAMLTHGNLVSNAFMFAAWIGGTIAKETFLAALPLFHIYGMTTSMNVPVILAAKIVLLPRFEPKVVLESIQQQMVTVFCGVPTMYSILLSCPELATFNLTSIRVCISGASSLPPNVQKKFMETTGGFLAEGYGLTEASPVTHCNPVDRTMKTVKVGSIGIPMPDTDARIVDTETGDRTLRPGEIGELVTKGPQIMKGYWRNSEESENVLRNGWLYTGDIGMMDERGYFYITNRKKDLIKYKDYSVYPREIEDVLYMHPAVKLCVVVGKPDPIAGEVPKAFVVLKEGAAASETDLIEFVKQKVASYKTLKHIEFRKELPISSAGKVLRRSLHEEEKQKAQA
jgi:long-chain acyl-CoA synthetase